MRIVCLWLLMWVGVAHAQELAPCPASPNCVSSLAAAGDAQHRVEAFVLVMPANKAWPLIQAAVAGIARTDIIEETEDYLHATVTSRVFRFVDDLELKLDALGQRVDVRSASRTGYGDLGVNRKRVEALRGQLQAMGVIASP